MGRITEVNMPTEIVNKELLCKNCIHGFVPLADWPNYYILRSHHWMKCRKTGKLDESTFNPVTGYIKKKADYKDCWEERDRSGGCGPSAKFWSPKHKKDLFKLLTR